MTPLTLKPHEVRRILEHGDAVIVRVVKPQPNGDGLSDDTDPCPPYPRRWMGSCGNEWKSPFGPVGGKLWVREAFRLTSHQRCATRYCVAYKCGPYKCGVFDPHSLDSAISWASPAQMSYNLSRLNLTLKSVEVKRVNEVTAKEIIGAGLEHDPEFMQPGKYKGDTDWLRRQLPKEYWDVIGHSNPFVWVGRVGG